MEVIGVEKRLEITNGHPFVAIKVHNPITWARRSSEAAFTTKYTRDMANDLGLAVGEGDRSMTCRTGPAIDHLSGQITIKYTPTKRLDTMSPKLLPGSCIRAR